MNKNRYLKEEKLQCNQHKWGNLFKSIGNGLIGICLLVPFIFGELIILIGLIATVIFCISGVMCFSAIVIPYVRNNWILIGFESNLFIKMIACLLVGSICIVLGYIGFKQINKWNHSYCRKGISEIKKRVEGVLYVHL